MGYKIELWEETKMQYGIGSVKKMETRWTLEKIKELCCNASVLENLKKELLNGINGIHVIEMLDGTFYINQFGGYTNRTGLFGFMVNPDNTLARFI